MKRKLIPLSKITSGKSEIQQTSKRGSVTERTKAMNILMSANRCWCSLERFRNDRERNRRYTYGDQWGDVINVDGRKQTEEEYIKSQGNIPLKNNLIRRLVRSVLGTYRSQSKEPTCTARDRDEQQLGETMSTVLQCNMQLNKMNEVYARSMEEFLVSGFIVHRLWYGWRNNKMDVWTDYVQPNNFFIDSNMRDFRGWDVSMLGELHDISFGELCNKFAKSPKDVQKLREIYSYSADREYINNLYGQFGYSEMNDVSFFTPNDPSLCRVIEVWRLENKPRIRCHDPLNGDFYKIDESDYESMVLAENRSRLAEAKEVGMDENEVPLIVCEWFEDTFWYSYFMSPYGDILFEEESPYDHKSHPYVFKAYPFIDGEIHSFVSDVIDQQRYTNRLITMYDWIMRSSAKGVLMFPEECKPTDMSMDEVADNWARVGTMIVYKAKPGIPAPAQISNNSTNIGITELLNLQLKFFEDISGVSASLQGKPGFSGQSASMYEQQTANSTKSLLDILDSFSSFVVDGAYKAVKLIQQYYDDKRMYNIAGSSSKLVEYDPDKMRDIEYDLSIVESTSTPAYRNYANDLLMQLFSAGAISVEQLLENGSFPFSDSLLQSIQSQKEQMQQGQVPEGVSPEVMQQAQEGANMDAVNTLYENMRQ